MADIKGMLFFIGFENFQSIYLNIYKENGSALQIACYLKEIRYKTIF